MDTKNYYEKNANEFFDNTVNVDMSEIRDKFLSYLKPGSKILDAGCGSGRDSLAFIQQGYEVEAFDLSETLAFMATEHIGQKVKVMSFLDIDYIEEFDGVWACASLLHLKIEELEEAFKQFSKSLKRNGIMYCSFKYGDYYGMRNGRYFTDMNEKSFQELLAIYKELQLVEMYVSEDVRQDREGQQWLNIITRKTQY